MQDAPHTTGAIRKPAWMTEQNPSKWSPAARAAVDLLISIAEERLQWEAAQAKPGPVSEVPIEQRMTVFLCDLLQHGPVEAHRLDSRLATQYELSISKATEIRRRLGFVPAFKGGPIVAPKGV